MREGRGIALTPGGRRLAALASEILGLAEQARRSVQDSPGATRRMLVVATSLVAEHVGAADRRVHRARRGPRDRGRVVPGAAFARRCSSTGGPTSRSALTPGPDRRRRSPSAPFLRCRLIIVAAPGHPLAGGARRSRRPRSAAERWLVGQPDLDPTTATGLFFARHGLAPREVATYSSQAAAIAAAAAGEGIVLTLTHAVVDEVRRRALVRLDVRGTPVVELWHASTLGLGRALPAALALQRFATTSEATQAISTGRAGAVSTRVRPKVHVTLWRSVADGIDAAAKR